MTDVEYRKTLYEVDEVFTILDKDLLDKIPESLREDIKLNKAENYDFKLDYSKKLADQKLLKTTEEYLTMLFLKYLCNEQEKAETLKAMQENENKYQEEIKEKYSTENLFKNNAKKTEKKQDMQYSNNLPIVVKKENIFVRIINKIKNIFHRA